MEEEDRVAREKEIAVRSLCELEPSISHKWMSANPILGIRHCATFPSYYRALPLSLIRSDDTG